MVNVGASATFYGNCFAACASLFPIVQHAELHIAQARAQLRHCDGRNCTGGPERNARRTADTKASGKAKKNISIIFARITY